MPVIAVVNCKGGSGKSTLAINLASHFANTGLPVMLGDADRQQSTQSWLRQRTSRALPKAAPVVGWAIDPQRVLRPPAGVRHVVLDTPGGLRGFELARVVACADVVLVPVGQSAFDRESSAECIAALAALPRVAAGACKVAVVGMRLDGRTRAAEVVGAWAAAHKVPLIGTLRETQAYVRCAENGLGVFDLPPGPRDTDVAQWGPIVAWLDKALREVKRPLVGGERVVPRALPVNTLRSTSAPMPLESRTAATLQSTTQRPLVGAGAMRPPVPVAIVVERPARRALTGMLAACFGWLPTPRVVHR